MGQCCASVKTDPDIERAKDVNEIIDVINEKRKILELEKEQIQKYLDDPTFDIETISIDNLSPEILKERIPYLDELDKAFETVNEKISKQPNIENMNLDILKEGVEGVITNYYLSYDPNGELKKSLKKFNESLERA